MSVNIGNGLFNFADRLQMSTLNHRLARAQVTNANIANAETPGYRALGYDFEEQLRDLTEASPSAKMKTSSLAHFRGAGVTAQGEIQPDVFVKPTESVPQDGNTVDVDTEMASLAENQINYRASVELLNRKIGMIRYAISGGGR
jgi:flagellar basal-body rod protein FlgB